MMKLGEPMNPPSRCTWLGWKMLRSTRTSNVLNETSLKSMSRGGVREEHAWCSLWPAWCDEYIAMVETGNECLLGNYMSLRCKNFYCSLFRGSVVPTKFLLVLLNTLHVEDETSNALVVVWVQKRSTLRITGRDTAQTERILLRLVDTSSLASFREKECLRVIHVLSLSLFLLSLPVVHARFVVPSEFSHRTKRRKTLLTDREEKEKTLLTRREKGKNPADKERRRTEKSSDQERRQKKNLLTKRESEKQPIEREREKLMKERDREREREKKSYWEREKPTEREERKNYCKREGEKKGTHWKIRRGKHQLKEKDRKKPAEKEGEKKQNLWKRRREKTYWKWSRENNLLKKKERNSNILLTKRGEEKPLLTKRERERTKKLTHKEREKHLLTKTEREKKKTADNRTDRGTERKKTLADKNLTDKERKPIDKDRKTTDKEREKKQTLLTKREKQTYWQREREKERKNTLTKRWKNNLLTAREREKSFWEKKYTTERENNFLTEKKSLLTEKNNQLRDGCWRRWDVHWMVLGRLGHVCSSGINWVTPLRQRKRWTLVLTEVCWLDNDGPRPKPSQPQGCAAERSGNHRWDGCNGHIPSCWRAWQYLVSGETDTKGFPLQLGSSWLLNGERRQERAALLGTKQLACWSTCVVAAGTAVTDDHMKDASVKQFHASSSSWIAISWSTDGACTCAEHVVNHQRVGFPVAWAGSPDLRDKRRALSTTVWVWADCSENWAGGGDTTCDAKDPSWSGTTLWSRATAPGGGPLASCAVVWVVRHGAWEGWLTPALWLAWAGGTTSCDSIRFRIRENDICRWRDGTEICYDSGCCGRRLVLCQGHTSVGELPWTDQIHRGILLQTRSIEVWRRASDGSSRKQEILWNLRRLPSIVQHQILLSVLSKLSKNKLGRFVQIARCALAMVKHFGTDKPIWAWLLRHAGWQIRRYKQKGNGMTAYKQAFGEHYTHEVVPFAEIVLVRVPRPIHRDLAGEKTLAQERRCVHQGCLGW